jgi:cysteine-rich repeat protein
VTDATVDPPKCGDHVVQDGEDCDDGNVIQDDGCDSVCKLSGTNPGSSRACPGLETHVWSSAVVYQGTTAGAGLVAELAQVCTSTSGGNPTRGAFGPDRLFHVVAHKTGTMTATLSDTTYDALLYVTSECQTSPKAIASLACSNDVNGVGNEALSFPVQAGASYTIVVDGAGVGQVEGSFRLTLAIR